MIATIETLSPQSTIAQARETIAKNIRPHGQKTLQNIWSDFLQKGLSQYSLEVHKYNFIENVNTITKYQTQAILGWISGGVGAKLTKFREVLANMDIARNMQEINLEGLSKTQSLSRMQALWKLAQDMPDLFRTFFGGGLSVAFYGIDIANSDDGWLESIIDSSMYILNIVGPGNLILNMWTSLQENGQLKWHEIAAGWAWGILLWMDVTQITKIWLDHKWNKALRIGQYVVRPITDIFSFGHSLAKTGINLVDVIKSKWDISLKDAINKWFARQGKIWTKWKALILFWILSAWYIGYEAWADDFEEEYELLVKNGIIDTQWNPLQSFDSLPSMTNEQKEVLTEIFFQKYSFQEAENLEYRVTWNTLTVTALDTSVGKWVVYQNGPVLTHLKNTLWIGVENITFVPAQA